MIILLSDLGRPSKEGLALQMELQKLQNARRQDEEEFKNQKQVLQAQLQNEVGHITASCRAWKTVFRFFLMMFCKS